MFSPRKRPHPRAGRGYTLGLTVTGEVLTAGYDKQNEMDKLQETSMSGEKVKMYSEWWASKNSEIVNK